MATNIDKNIVLTNNLSTVDFRFDQADKKIKVNFPPQPTGNITDLVFAGNKLKFSKDGAPQEIDLSPLAVDVSVDTATYDATTGVVTFRQDEGGKTVTLDLNSLKAVIGNDATSAVTLTGRGTTTDPFKADVKLKAGSDNLLSKDSVNGQLSVDKDVVKAAVAEKLAEFDTITFKDAFGEVIGKTIKLA